MQSRTPIHLHTCSNKSYPSNRSMWIWFDDLAQLFVLTRFFIYIFTIPVSLFRFLISKKLIEMSNFRLLLIKMRNSKLRTGILGTVFLFIFVYFYAPQLLFAPGEVRYTVIKAKLPHETEEFDPSDCKNKNIKELMKGPMNQVDRRLIRAFKKYYLDPPSDAPYNIIEDKEGGPEDGMSDIVVELLNQQRAGFFIEARAKLVDKSTSQFESNTLHLEKEYGWEGVLVEPDEEVYELLKAKNRKAWLVPGMLSPSAYPQQTGFFPELEQLGPEEIKLVQSGHRDLKVKIVQAFPIITILASLKKRKIDYLSLTAQGREVEILNTIPFQKIQIKVITIDHARNMGVYQVIKQLLEGQGFIFVSSLIRDKYETSIYAHPSLFE